MGIHHAQESSELPARRFRGIFALLLFTGIAIASSADSTSNFAAKPQENSPQDQTFWQSIIKNDFARPPDHSIRELSRSLSGMLGSPNPEVRDEIAFSILVRWIYTKQLLTTDDLRPLIVEWTTNLTRDVGSVGNDSVALRSFSALILSVAIARDNETPFLTEMEFRAVLENAIAYAAAEKDLRGYDPEKGWLHSAAHTADLLKFLGRNRYLKPADQAAILTAVEHKLRASNIVFSFGEDERLARAVLSLINRKDFDEKRFREWLTRIRPSPPESSKTNLLTLIANQNVKNMLSKLDVVLLYTSPDSPRTKETAADLQECLKGTF